MAISSSFASRLVLRIAPALLFSFVFSISTSYAARIHLPLYDGPRMDANCLSIRSSYDFLTLSKTSLLFLLVGTLDAPAPPLRDTASPSTHTPSVPNLS